MWLETKKTVDALENTVSRVTFTNSLYSVIKVVPNCGCSSASINGKSVTLSVNTGKIGYGDSKVKRTSAEVTTSDGNKTTLRVEINVRKNAYQAAIAK